MIIQNAIEIKETGQILKSCHRHDFRVVHDDKENVIAGVDGGLDYIRRIGNKELWNELCVNKNDFIEVKKEKLLWGTCGKSGNEPLKHVKLKDLETDHLKKILKLPVNETYKEVIEYILKER